MSNNQDEELKKEFQLERIIFFSDAVFAIIITIMILDVKLPEVERYLSEKEAKGALLRIMPKLTGYALSFYVVGKLWMKHLRVFHHLKDYNVELLTLNLLFLFSVSLFPFATSFFFNSTYIMQYTWGVFTYIAINYFTIFTHTLLAGYVIHNKTELCDHTVELETSLRWKVKRFDYFQLPVVLILMVVTMYFKLDFRDSLYVVLGPVVVFNVIRRKLKNRYYPNHMRDRVTVFSLFRKAKPKLSPKAKEELPTGV